MTILELKQKVREELTYDSEISDFLDKNFPKGISKDRVKAIVLVVEFVRYAEELIDRTVKIAENIESGKRIKIDETNKKQSKRSFLGPTERN